MAISRTAVGRKVTVLEVARCAKVSQASVYAALNPGKQTTIGISDETRQRVLRVAHELGYVRNDLARSLVTGRTHTIGVLVHSLQNQYFNALFNYIDDSCSRDGYTVFIANSEFDSEREARGLRAFLSRRIDGLIIARDPMHRTDDLLERLADQGTPIVTLGELGPDVRYPNVTFDEVLGHRLAAEHLYRAGHRRVMYFNAGKARGSNLPIHANRQRYFAEAWQAIGGELAFFETADAIHGGNELGEHVALLPEHRRPTAVACSNDRLAISLMAGLAVQKITVPDQLAVIGYDDIEAAAEQKTPLTTVRLSVEDQARVAWELLKKGLSGAEADDQPAENVVLEPRLIVRESA